MTPTLVTSCTSLPPGGAGLAWGGPARRPIARNLAVNASLVHPRTAVPALSAPLLAGDHTIACLVYASPSPNTPKFGANGAPGATSTPNFGVDDAGLHVPDAALELLDRITTQEAQ